MPENEKNKVELTDVRDYRALLAYFFMFSFVAFTSLGAFLIYPPTGFIVLGISSGFFGYLLGAN